MDLDTCFSLANSTALAGWVVLALAPRWRWSAGMIGPVVVPVLLAMVYGVLIVPRLLQSEGGFGSLDAIAQLFESRELLLAGWIHYLAFDLFIGSWEVRDAQRVGIPHRFVLPCLALTFLLGPLGLALYLALRATKRRTFIDDCNE